MSIIYSLFIFFLSVPMHACNARHFGVVNKDSVSTQLQFNSQDKVKALDLNSIEVGTSKGSEILDKGNYQGSAITRAESMKDLKAILSGSEILFSSHVRLLKATNIEGWRKRAVLSVGSDTDEAEEGVEFNNKKAHHDDQEQKDHVAAVMDYEPPHQTPSIHNRQT
ncbi:hypothetical protein OWV82_019902 [Melia azedarach]|uniref:Uncharacterized protein n=1 Tax=Melia azedarach TaxID=155640 RepID=A0ACC1X4J2_MELAZ|nr:hypothetical protein OWV82_019902 [Melia azedarach]